MKITIHLNTNEDPSTVLDAAIEAGQALADELDAEFDENEVSVEG